jgi:hypothetical protein
MEMVEAAVGRSRGPGDACRRYRPVQFTFDTRAAVLDTVIGDDCDPGIQEQWRGNISRVREGLLHQLGGQDGEDKIEDFRALGTAPWSVVAAHNGFLAQVRTAFAVGAHYPALLGAAGLGERILNDLIRDLRTDYDDHSATARVRGKESVDNWPAAIRVLREWGVLTDSLADDYLQLGRLRNAAVHYRPGLEAAARENALEAVLLLQRLVEGLFTPLGGPPLFIDGITGSSFLARASEDLPLVRRYYLPNAVLVSPRYDVRPGDRPGLFLYYYDADYGGLDRCDGMTDEQFADALRGDGATA